LPKKIKAIKAIVHEIAKDGLPDMDRLGNRVAFIFDGCVVSGWPLNRRSSDGEVLWEGNTDVSHKLAFHGVTHWIEFPEDFIPRKRGPWPV
jgi:hypothetical protein